MGNLGDKKSVSQDVRRAVREKNISFSQIHPEGGSCGKGCCWRLDEEGIGILGGQLEGFVGKYNETSKWLWRQTGRGTVFRLI
jgi:hypothetical protein